MTTTSGFHLVSTAPQSYIAPCLQCGKSFDLATAGLCHCIAREQTFACPHCASCACSAPASRRAAFWSAAPPSLWERRKREKVAVDTPSIQSLDPSSPPRPFALIVDDDPIVLAVAERALQAIGFTTLASSKPEEAYSIAASLLPDVVLTDALMPKLDGRDLCLRLKQNPLTSMIKVIVMSALYKGLAYRNEAFKTFQVDAYLEKPIIPNVLRDAINQLMPELKRNQRTRNDARMAS